MPSGPKSKMVMKFDFEDMSDSGQDEVPSPVERPVSSLLASNKMPNLNVKREELSYSSKVITKPGLKLQINLDSGDNDEWPHKPTRG